MRRLRLLRVAYGMPCMLLAALLLVAQMLAPAMALQLRSVDPAGQLALQTICHSDAPGAPGPPADPGHRDCLLCPACHLGSQSALPTPIVPPVPPPPALGAIDIGAPLPPATGPPSRFRATAQPRGPPTSSI